jgi:hypothetical protein
MICRAIVERDPLVPLTKKDFRIVAEVMLDGSVVFRAEQRYTLKHTGTTKFSVPQTKWDRLTASRKVNAFTADEMTLYPDNRDIHLTEQYIDNVIADSIHFAEYTKSTIVVKTIIHKLT